MYLSIHRSILSLGKLLPKLSISTYLYHSLFLLYLPYSTLFLSGPPHSSLDYLSLLSHNLLVLFHTQIYHLPCHGYLSLPS